MAQSKQVVILGAGQGGLSAAIHLRLKGHQVLVLEKGANIGGKAAQIEIAGYRLDPGPSIIILKHLYEDVFKAAGKNPDDYIKFTKLDPFTRVFFEGWEMPVDLPSDETACLEVVKRIAPEDYITFKDVMNRLSAVAPYIDKTIFKKPYHQPWQLADKNLIATALKFNVQKTYKELVDSFFQSPLLRAFFYGFPSYGGQTFDSKAPGALLIPFFMIRHGVFYPVGGVSAIPKAFHKLAVELGVEFRTNARVVGLEHDKGEVTHVRLEGGEVIETETVVSNIDHSTTMGWLGHGQTVEASMSYFTLHWGVPKPMPEVLHHTLLIPKGFEQGFDQLYRQKKFPNPPIVYLNNTTAHDSSTAPAGKTNLFAVVTAPAITATCPWEDTEPYRQATRQVMERFGIEVGDEVDFQREQSPLYFQSEHENYRGSLYGLDEQYRLWGLFPPRLKAEKFNNLYFCGGSVQPGAGLPMVTLSGKFVAELI